MAANEGFFGLATSITTPISLAALALLILSFIFSQLVKQNVNKSNAPLLRDIAKYMFIVGIFFGLAAITLVVSSQFINSEILVTGNITDGASNEPVYGATVSIVGGPSREVSDDGSFEFSLPRSRFSAGYILKVTEDEYEPVTLDVKSSLSAPHNISLKKRILDQSIFQQYNGFAVGHWIGRPMVQIDFNLENQNDAIVVVKDFAAALKGPDGRVQNFAGMRVNGIFPPITTKMLYLHHGSAKRIMGTLFEPNDQFLALSSRVNQWVATHPSTINPMDRTERLDPALAKDLQDTANGNFFWTTGEWTFSLRIRCEDKTRTYDTKFTLTEQQISNMKTNIPEYIYGFGVLDPLMFAGSDPYHGSVRVSVE